MRHYKIIVHEESVLDRITCDRCSAEVHERDVIKAEFIPHAQMRERGVEWENFDLCLYCYDEFSELFHPEKERV